LRRPRLHPTHLLGQPDRPHPGIPPHPPRNRRHNRNPQPPPPLLATPPNEHRRPPRPHQRIHHPPHHPYQHPIRTRHHHLDNLQQPTPTLPRRMRPHHPLARPHLHHHMERIPTTPHPPQPPRPTTRPRTTTILTTGTEPPGVLCRCFAGAGSRVRASLWSASNSTGGIMPSELWRRRLLYQSTQPAVANSTSESVL